MFNTINILCGNSPQLTFGENYSLIGFDIACFLGKKICYILTDFFLSLTFIILGVLFLLHSLPIVGYVFFGLGALNIFITFSQIIISISSFKNNMNKHS